MAGKMSLCIIKYTYTRYVGVDIEKYTHGIYEYVKEAFGELQPQMSEPGTIPDMPDYLDGLHIRRRTYSRMPLLPYRRRRRRCLGLPYYQGISEENDEEMVLVM